MKAIAAIEVVVVCISAFITDKIEAGDKDADRLRCNWPEDQGPAAGKRADARVAGRTAPGVRANLDTLDEIAGCLGCELSELIAGASKNSRDYLTRELAGTIQRMNARQRGMFMEIAEIIMDHECCIKNAPPHCGAGCVFA